MKSIEHIESLKRVEVTIDGQVREVYEGLTILQALQEENIYVPHLCYDIRLERANGNCGLCIVELHEKDRVRDVKACQTPISAGMTIVTKNGRLKDYRKLRLEQLLSDHNADCTAPCVNTCPAGIDIQSYLAQVAMGNFHTALQIIKDSNPFPSACGRVCPHPCEAACRRELVDSAVGINHVKRFVADLDLDSENPWMPTPAEKSGKRIAVVGSGPAGLTAAYYSALMGHEVTVFERLPQPGGMLRYGIPEYRLPKAQLDREIDQIRRAGVEIRCNQALGGQLRLEELKNEYDAVFLGIGSWRATALQITGETLPGVWLGIRYLEEVTRGREIELGEHVVVVGGGNTAIDCARTALRQGAGKVSLVYRRTRKEMPAEEIEIVDALEEGIEMHFLSAPLGITLDENGRKQLQIQKMELGEPDRSGRRRPVPIEGSEYYMPVDTVISAVGQSTDTQFLYNDLPLGLNRWGDIDIDGRRFMTNEAGIFAGGDCVTGPATVVQAVGAGRHAAKAMDSWLRTGEAKPAAIDYSCNRGSLEDLPQDEFAALPRLARLPVPSRPVESRIDSFIEVELTMDEASAIAEASRCLKCGCSARKNCHLRNEATAHEIEFEMPIHERPFFPIEADHPYIIRDMNKCIACGRCIAVCKEVEGPDVLGYHIKEGRLVVTTKDGGPLSETDCVSCGQCVDACPCGALDYRREHPAVFKALHNPEKTVVAFVAPAVRSVISAEYGVSSEEVAPFMAGLLKGIGFDKVFDFTFAADLTILEETSEFLGRVKGGGQMPQFTSCCPGWVNFVEKRYPELIPKLSTCKSPQQMMGVTVKEHYAKLAGIDRENLYVVSIVPCMAKKTEAARPEFTSETGNRDVDAVLTTTELLDIVKLTRFDINTVVPQDFDEPYKRVSGAGILFGASGGVAEAALRMAGEILSGQIYAEPLEFEDLRGFEGVKHTEIDINGQIVRVAVISGLANAEPFLKRLVAGEDIGYDLIEIMACPGGCISGAGHPVPTRVSELASRQKTLVKIDKQSDYRKSQENPDILRLYDDFYGEPNSELAHHLLHTRYTNRKK